MRIVGGILILIAALKAFFIAVFVSTITTSIHEVYFGINVGTTAVIFIGGCVLILLADIRDEINAPIEPVQEDMGLNEKGENIQYYG